MKLISTPLSKVPEATLVFWLIKIAATTLGETGGDAVSMSMNLGGCDGPNTVKKVLSFCVLDHNYRNNYRRYDPCGLS